MHIYINNKLAALKQGTSFEYVSENRLFSGSDGYTLNISFPLRGCPQNIDIFGHLYRADVSARKLVFDCEIVSRGLHRFGSIVVNEINEVEVKTQFLEGRSEQNFSKSLDKVFINELDLGGPVDTLASEISPADAWSPAANDFRAVALPWVNVASDLVHNGAAVPEGRVPKPANFIWNKDVEQLSWTPYLLHITERILSAVGYSCDLSPWYDDPELRFLVVTNVLPADWNMPEFARALPHWSVEEFFSKLELFLGCEFDFDHRARSVSFVSTVRRIDRAGAVTLTDVVEEHSTEVAVEEVSCSYLGLKNVVYRDCSHEAWKFYSCDWFVRAQSVQRYASLSEVLEWFKSRRLWNGRDASANIVLYAADVDSHFILEPVAKNVNDSGGVWFECVLRPVNLFGGRIVSTEVDAPKVEIDIVPAHIDRFGSGSQRMLFVNPSSRDDPEDSDVAIPAPLRCLKAGEADKSPEFFDRIFLAWWNGQGWTPLHHLPHPHVAPFEVRDDWSGYDSFGVNLRLNTSRARIASARYNIDPQKKSTFKFLADAVPDVRALFLINGKRYICEKITATFSEQGMSQLLKGVFYPVLD